MSKHSALNTLEDLEIQPLQEIFENNEVYSQSERMTLDGAVNKTAILLALCFAGAFAGWNVPALAMPGLIIGTILAFVTIFRSPAKAGTTAPFYAAFEGMALWRHNGLCRNAISWNWNSGHWAYIWNSCFFVILL